MSYEKQSQSEKQKVVLAVDPTVRGFGYIVFENPREPIDWGKADVRHFKNVTTVKRVEKLIAFYKPDVLVTEKSEGSIRSPRVQELLKGLENLATKTGTHYASYSKDDVKDLFVQFGATSKYEIASVIAEWLPELSYRLPPKRKVWMPQDERFGIFDAAALAVVWYFRNS